MICYLAYDVFISADFQLFSSDDCFEGLYRVRDGVVDYHIAEFIRTADFLPGEILSGMQKKYGKMIPAEFVSQKHLKTVNRDFREILL